MTEYTELYNDIAKLLKGAGLSLVEFNFDRKKVKAEAVIYKPGGTGVDDCSRAHKLIKTRLEAWLGNDDFFLETASPGIDRVLLSAHEYEVFVKKGVKIHLVNEDNPVEGCIESSDGKTLIVRDNSGNMRSIEIEKIKKGKLDYTQEGR